MTKYKCNHCGEEININVFPHEAGFILIKSKYYCIYCIREIASHFINNATYE